MREPLWLDERDALAVHDRVLTLHGGATGVRDHGPLLSALARPRQHFAYAQARDMPYLAALCTAGIVRNHPFVDGNKRTGFVLGILFLELNGFVFTGSEQATAAAVVALAAGDLDAQGYATFLTTNSRYHSNPSKG